MASEQQQIIMNFIKQRHLMTICTAMQLENDPTKTEIWCANCFYVTELQEGKLPRLYFMSTTNTKHAKFLLSSSVIAGTIATDTLNITEIQGIQFSGVAGLIDKNALNYPAALELYQNRFEIARKMIQPLWFIEIDKIKYTRNKPVFGEKFTWEK